MAVARFVPWLLVGLGALLVGGGAAWWLLGNGGGGDDAGTDGPLEPGVVRVEQPDGDDRRRYEDMLEAFTTAAASADGGGLLKLEAALSAGKPPAEGAARPMQGRATFQWGREGVTFATFELSSNGQPIAKEQRYCDGRHTTRIFGAQILVERMAAPSGGLHCVADRAFGDFGSLADPAFDDGMRVRSIEHLDTGGRTVRMRNADDARLALRLDANGTLRSLDYEAGETAILVFVTYGEPAPLVVPEGTRRVPASILLSGPVPEGRRSAWNVTLVGAPVPLSELEADIHTGLDENGTDPVRASFLLFPGRDQEQEGVSFRFEDTDHDGNLSVGDRILVAAAGASEPPTIQFQDLWAGAPTQPVQRAPGPWVLLPALLAGAAALRRRR